MSICSTIPCNIIARAKPESRQASSNIFNKAFKDGVYPVQNRILPFLSESKTKSQSCCARNLIFRCDIIDETTKCCCKIFMMLFMLTMFGLFLSVLFSSSSKDHYIFYKDLSSHVSFSSILFSEDIHVTTRLSALLCIYMFYSDLPKNHP